MKRANALTCLSLIALGGAFSLFGACDSRPAVTDPNVPGEQGQAGAAATGGQGGAAGGAGGASGTSGSGGMGGEGGAGGVGGVGGEGGSGGPPTPVQPHKLAAGSSHTCALRNEGEVHCWGPNGSGELGDGTKVDQAAPVPVVLDSAGARLTGAQSIALGDLHTCALVAGGEVRCWGSNTNNQLGSGPSGNQLFPVPVVLDSAGTRLTRARALALGGSHACALVDGGEVLCWGANAYGEIGNGTAGGSQPYPAPVLDASGGRLAGASALASSSGNTCTIMGGGELRCWGYNQNGELGDGSTENRPSPAPVVLDAAGARLTGASAVASGPGNTCAIVGGGEVRCWGSNLYGQIGDGTQQNNRPYPVPVVLDAAGARLTGAQVIAVSGLHACAIVEEGEVRCWGYNGKGELGDGSTTNRSFPVAVALDASGARLKGAQTLALGDTHSCALMNDGGVRCWGDNEFRQLGDGTTTGRPYPTPVAFLALAPPTTLPGGRSGRRQPS